MDYRIFNVCTWSFLCVRIHTGVGLTNSESAQHFFLVLLRVWTSDLRILSPTLYQLSHPVTLFKGPSNYDSSPTPHPSNPATPPSLRDSFMVSHLLFFWSAKYICYDKSKTETTASVQKTNQNTQADKMWTLFIWTRQNSVQMFGKYAFDKATNRQTDSSITRKQSQSVNLSSSSSSSAFLHRIRRGSVCHCF